MSKMTPSEAGKLGWKARRIKIKKSTNPTI